MSTYLDSIVGGPARALATTGAPANVGDAAPPNPGDVLTAVTPTQLEWAPGSGGDADGLGTTGDPVDVASADPPVAGQVLTATDEEHAVWRVPGLHYDPSIKFWTASAGSATIGPGSWGFIEQAVGATDPIVVYIVSSLEAPPVDSRFGLYVGRDVTVPVSVQVLGASQIQGLDGVLGASTPLLPGADYEWVFYHEDGAALWGLVSDTAAIAKGIRTSGGIVSVKDAAPPTAGAALVAADATHAAWTPVVKADIAGYPIKTTPVNADLVYLGDSAAGNAIAKATLASVIALAPTGGATAPAGTSNPFLRVPAVPNASFDDEFEGGNPDLAVRGWSITHAGTAMTRIGPVLPGFNQGSSDILNNQYRSSIIGSVLFLQVQQTVALEILISKTIAPGSVTWPNGLMGTARVGAPGSISPTPGWERIAGFFVAQNSSGLPNMSNRVEACTRATASSNTNIAEMFGVVAGTQNNATTPASEAGSYGTKYDITGLYVQPSASGNTTQVRVFPAIIDSAHLSEYGGESGVVSLGYTSLVKAGVRLNTGAGSVSPPASFAQFAIDFVRLYIGDVSQKLPANG